MIEGTKGVVVIDEAYVDFAADNCLDFAREYDNVVVARGSQGSAQSIWIQPGTGMAFGVADTRDATAKASLALS